MGLVLLGLSHSQTTPLAIGRALTLLVGLEGTVCSRKLYRRLLSLRNALQGSQAHNIVFNSLHSFPALPFILTGYIFCPNDIAEERHYEQRTLWRSCPPGLKQSAKSLETNEQMGKRNLPFPFRIREHRQSNEKTAIRGSAGEKEETFLPTDLRVIRK